MKNLQKENDILRASNKLLIERLSSCHSAIDSATDGLIELYGLSVIDSNAFMELSSQLAPNEELLMSIENNSLDKEILSFEIEEIDSQIDDSNYTYFVDELKTYSLEDKKELLDKLNKNV